MGSSKMASLRESLLQLDLIVEDKESRRTINLELNKDELDTMINSLERLVWWFNIFIKKKHVKLV